MGNRHETDSGAKNREKTKKEHKRRQTDSERNHFVRRPANNCLFIYIVKKEREIGIWMKH